MSRTKQSVFLLLVATLLGGVPTVAFAFQTHAPQVHAERSAVSAPPKDMGNATAEAAEGEEVHAPKPINWTDFSNHEQPPLVFMVLNFVVLLGIYYKFGKGPISEGLKSRRATIAREIEEAARMRKEAEDRAVKYQEKLSHLEAELKETRETLKDATFLIEQELKQLRSELTREAVETAVVAAEELLKKRITGADQERLAEDYLSQLASRRPSGRERALSIPPGSMGPAGGE
jgi:F-type H+-transporting ATPase subunit b